MRQRQPGVGRRSVAGRRTRESLRTPLILDSCSVASYALLTAAGVARHGAPWRRTHCWDAARRRSNQHREVTALRGLDGRVALVTGAARGIGAATARRLAQEGARVILADLNEESCERTAAEIARGGAQTLALGCDVADDVAVRRTVERGLERFGKLDILVNNPGILRDNVPFKMTDDDWDSVLNVHLRGAFLCARAAQAAMVEQRYGRLVSVSSTSALGNRGQANIAAAKAGIQGLTRPMPHILTHLYTTHIHDPHTINTILS